MHTLPLRDTFGREDSLRALNALSDSFSKKDWGVTKVAEDIHILVTPDFVQMSVFLFQNRPFLLLEDSPLEKRQAAFSERHFDIAFFDPEVDTAQFAFFPDKFRQYVDKAFVDRAFHFSK